MKAVYKLWNNINIPAYIVLHILQTTLIYIIFYNLYNNAMWWALSSAFYRYETEAQRGQISHLRSYALQEIKCKSTASLMGFLYKCEVLTNTSRLRQRWSKTACD